MRAGEKRNKVRFLGSFIPLTDESVCLPKKTGIDGVLKGGQTVEGDGFLAGQHRVGQ